MDDIYARCNIATLNHVGYVEVVGIESWKATMKEEMKMIEKINTWPFVNKPKNQKVINVKWVYTTKLNPNGFVNKLKARLVVKYYFQQYGIDFLYIFAPNARHDTIILLVVLVAKLDGNLIILMLNQHS